MSQGPTSLRIKAEETRHPGAAFRQSRLLPRGPPRLAKAPAGSTKRDDQLASVRGSRTRIGSATYGIRRTNKVTTRRDDSCLYSTAQSRPLFASCCQRQSRERESKPGSLSNCVQSRCLASRSGLIYAVASYSRRQ